MDYFVRCPLDHYALAEGRGLGFFNHIMDRREGPLEAMGSGVSSFVDQQRTGQLRGHLEASDPRDLIFALWGYHTMPPSLEPDYTLTTEIVFERAIIAYIDESRDLSALYLSSEISQSAEHDSLVLPSWVPDLRRARRVWPASGDPHGVHFACLDYRHRCTQQRPGALPVRGKVISHIEYTSSLALEDYEPGCEGLSISLSDLDADAMRFGALVPDGTTECSLPITWRLRPQQEAVNFAWDVYSLQKKKVELLSRHERSGEDSDAHTESAEASGMRAVFELEYPTFYGTDVVSYRRLALTACGRMCLVPRGAFAGDVVAILHGSSFPVILRHEVASSYRLVGEAFVEGTMEGEAVNWAEDEADTLELV